MDQPRPNRRMTDMGPRRMDGFGPTGRPAGAPPVRPAAQPPQPIRQVAPQPQPRQVQAQARPVQRAAAPARQVRPAGYQQPQSVAQAASEAKPAKRGGAWKVVLQFVIGLLVIAAVAIAIVMLYKKYYQQ